MTTLALLLRTLRHFRLANLAVAAGMVVATAVLTGAMMVGDSVRGSLGDLAAQRLGPVDHALVAPRFFSDTLAQRLVKSSAFSGAFDGAHAGILVRGGAGNVNAATGEPDQRTAGVQIAALEGDWSNVAPDACVINGELAASLPAVRRGSDVQLWVPLTQDGPRDAALSRRGRGDVTNSMQAKCARIASEPGFLSMFNLAGGQRLGRNAWANLGDLQDTVGQSGRANVILVHAKPGHGTEKDAQTLNRILHDTVDLDDYGLSFTTSPDKTEAILNSADTYLSPSIIAAALPPTTAAAAAVTRVSSYLMNTVADVSSGKTIHYAMIAGISALGGKPLPRDEIALNQWTADHLGAKPGDTISLAFYHRQPNGDLKEIPAGIPFKVGRILPMTGLGADPSLTPTYKGLTDSDTVREWKEPEGLRINRDWVTKDDEDYWKQYKAAPKLFVSLEAAHELWAGPYGEVTSIRLPAERQKDFAEALRRQIDPAAMGLTFRAVRADQLAASSGGTDFGELFLYFSFFLIVAAVLLVAMLFRLSIEQRARQLGVMAAIGFAPKRLRRLALVEGMIVAAAGAAIGLLAAIAYTAAMMAGLRTWWVGAVGTTQMRLHVVPMTLAIGFVSSLLVAAGAILWGVWRVGRVAPAQLLAGGWGTETKITSRRKWAAWIGWGLIAVAGGLLAAGAAKAMEPQGAFLGGGTSLLLGGLILVSARLRPRTPSPRTPGEGRGGGLRTAAATSVLSLGFRNASRHVARSTLTMGLIAFATFTLVTVAAFRGQGAIDTGDPKSGAGGYRLMLTADIPLLGDPGTPAGRNVLAVANPDDSLWSRLKFTPMRRWAGEDISCLNLTRPGSPTILSVPESMVQRDAFTFARTIKKVANPWTLLNEKRDGNAVPVIADDETAEWIMHLGLGKTLDVTDQTGSPRKLVLVATLAGSIFQGQLLMGEENFLRLFPSQSGAGVVLVDVDPKDQAAAQTMLATELGDFSVSVDRTADVLAMYKNVQNTYLSTFQVLGSLGLLLGTVGLAVVLLRGLVERKAELAMLAAIGFRRIDRLRMVLSENVLLLLCGLLVGAICAAVAVLPELIQSARKVHMLQLLATLAAVLALGLISLALAVWFGNRHITAADLRAE
jgi:ABC-type lipoprotein release transport system permease subunit